MLICYDANSLKSKIFDVNFYINLEKFSEDLITCGL